jgi:hypothetical protein
MGDGADDALSRMLDIMEYEDLGFDDDPEGWEYPRRQLTIQEKKAWGKAQRKKEQQMLGQCRVWQRKRLIEMELKYRRQQLKKGE